MAKKKKQVESITHEEAARRNIPTAEFESVMEDEDKSPIQVAYKRRNHDLDPQLVWRGKDLKDWSDLVVQAPPLFIQEKVHPKILIDDLKSITEEQQSEEKDHQFDLFGDFNGLPDDNAKFEFYQHDQNWSNRMILGDSLQVMASLAEKEGLRGKVQSIYLDPPYGIKFNSNFQWSTTSRDVKDGKQEHITREPEQVKAFRDTWRDGIHSYLTYLRDRLTVARELLTESGSIFVQIGDENVHRVRALMDEIFGEDNFIGEITFVKTSGLSSTFLANRFDYLMWYGRNKKETKFRQPFFKKEWGAKNASTYSWLINQKGQTRSMTQNEKSSGLFPEGYVPYKAGDATSQGNPSVEFVFQKKKYELTSKTTVKGLKTLAKADRIHVAKNSIAYIRKLEDFPVMQVSQLWPDTGTGSFTDKKIYIVQTGTKTIQRCVLMTTDPGDLVLDPTCGSGTTAFVAEQWGRRWITVDTSRVALALARSRIMGAKYPYYLLADSREGQEKEAELSGKEVSTAPTYENIKHGFVYERVPHITLGAIANNTEIDVIWDQFQEKLEPLREQLNESLDQSWEEWEIPGDFDEWLTTKAQGHEVSQGNNSNDSGFVPSSLSGSSKDVARRLHEQWWKLRIKRQKEIDASIAAKAEFEYLYDKPYEDNSKVRVAGPFTVESLSPHRILHVDENDEIVDPLESKSRDTDSETEFVKTILENIEKAGVQQVHKEDRITFSSVTGWPGHYICAEGIYEEGEKTKRAGIFIGPEFGTISRPNLVAAAREAGDGGFDVLISFGFSYDAHASEFDQLGKVPVLRAHMNADLHMADDLKKTDKGNLFVIFGEPDIEILDAEDDQIKVQINGVDVFDPNTGEIRSDNADGIACWFIDTDYNEESFFVRHAYFLGANDPYKSLKTTLRAEINEEAWETLNSDISRPFDKPKTGRIAVKVINHLGDEVMKVYKVE